MSACPSPEPKPGSIPFWAKCRACAHCWIAAYYPLELGLFAKVSMANGKLCPRCGADKPVIAKQDKGILQEEGQTGGATPLEGRLGPGNDTARDG